MTSNGKVRRGVYLSIALIILGMMWGVAAVAYAKQSPSKADKVTICHNPGSEPWR
jgi:hypothetical protein